MTHRINIIEQSNTRIALWDNAKYMLITLVVIGHFVEHFTDVSDTCRSIFLYIYAFHMPLFIFISGIFYREHDTKKKIVYYISCGFAIKIALSCTSYLVNGSMGFSLLTDGGVPWFMFSLATFQAVMYLLKGTNKNYILAFSIILACFVGYDQAVNDFLYLSRSIVFFPFFLIGTMFKQHKVLDFIKKHFKVLFPVSMLVLTLWLYLCFFQLDNFYFCRYLFSGKNPFWPEIIKYGPLARLLCYFISFLTGMSFLVITPKYNIPIVTSFGSRTLNVYFWHWPIYMLLVKCLNIYYLFDMCFLGKIAFIIIAIFLSFAIMSIKYFDYPLNIIKKACFYDKSTL